MADFIVPALRIYGDHYNTSIGTEGTFIPNFKQIVTDKIEEINPVQINGLAVRFDPDHFCFNYLQKHEEQDNTIVATTEYLFPPQLTTALRLLNKRILRGDPRILVDAYAIYHYYINHTNWDSYCSHLYKHITPEISALYENMSSEHPRHEGNCSIS